MRTEKAITLVALVITIIVLLILAGVTISLVIGDNGLLKKTQYAGEEYTKSAIKEEIELGIMDINAELASKTPPQGLTKQEIIDRLQDHIQEVITIDTDMTGEYKGYEYWIDDDYVVHIGDKVNGMKARMDVKVGTSHAVVTVTATSTFGTIKEYAYLVNGSEVKRTTDSTYSIEELEPETTYTLQVLAIDEKGNEKLTQTQTITTEGRTYLYKEGEEYQPITGGWTMNRYCIKESNKFFYAALPDTGWNGGTTNNRIDLTNYSRAYVQTNQENTAITMFIAGDSPFTVNSWLSSVSYDKTSKMDISSLKGEHYIWFYSSHGSGYCLSINAIWLEK